MGSVFKRELHDRWLERVNADTSAMLVARGKYDVARRALANGDAVQPLLSLPAEPGRRAA